MKINRMVVQLSILVTIALLVGGCTVPLPLPTGVVSQTDSIEPAPTPESMSDLLLEEGGAMATVATRSLRVRQLPDESSDVVAGIAEGESYRVLALSDDGLWVQLAIDSAPDGNGWVSTNFVSVEGDITDLNGSDSSAEADANLTLVPTPQSGFGVVNTDGVRLRVRGGPSADEPIVGYIYDGESYPILETSADGQWVRIPASTGSNTDNAEGGWVAAEFLTVAE